jgi:curved DNA-binding protein CbpA
MDLYNILEINSNATEIEIRKAYYKLAKKYHPDKNNSKESNNKFIQIQTAYEILINTKSKYEYTQMSEKQKYTFNEIFNKIINNNLNFVDLIEHCDNLDKNDLEYIKNHFFDFLHKINIEDILNLIKGLIVKKNNNINYSDSDLDVYEDIYADYFYILPFSLQKYNELDIRIELNINIDDIIKNNKRKIKIKRNINDDIIFSTFIFNTNHPYIVFFNLGDINNSIDNSTGNLIIKLNLQDNIYWDNDTILLNKNISLYEMIYGINIKMIINNININIIDWIPYKDGIIINLNENYNLYTNSFKHNLLIKLFLIYDDNINNKNILKEYFS